MTDDDVAVGSALGPGQLPQLAALYGSTWWAADRTAADIAAMAAASDLVVTLARRFDGRLVGFARVLTDFTYVALILDVIVAPGSRGAGWGARLMTAVVERPELAGVRSLELVCQPELVGFYERWGFTAQVGRSRLMRRTDNPRLTGG
ncbi:GNAT family N-acetyltransferase [Streptomyces sp. NPDC051940]|uniref:GNAT family N-acetyltransferase n=1 Tax=Streptomyces sp. NPDC051940 TaxID=3155675 RepID=UPI003435530E